MMKQNKEVSKKKELALYVLFGTLTTVVNLVVFYLCEGLFSGMERSYLLSNVIAWAMAVLFAFVTNKQFVFCCCNWSRKTVIVELAEFTGARAASFLIEEFGLFLLVDLLQFSQYQWTAFSVLITGELLAKVILAVIVVILNYFFSKFVIFKKA